MLTPIKSNCQEGGVISRGVRRSEHTSNEIDERTEEHVVDWHPANDLEEGVIVGGYDGGCKQVFPKINQHSGGRRRY